MLPTYQKSKPSSKNDCFKDGYVNLLSHHKNSQAHVSRTLRFFLRLLRMICQKHNDVALTEMQEN